MGRNSCRYKHASSAEQGRAIASRRRFIHAAGGTGLVLAAALAAVTGADAQRAGGGRGQQDAPTGTPGGPIYTPPSPAMNISGVWWTQSYSPKIQVLGGDLPLNEKGSAQYARNMGALKDGTLKDEARHLCVPDGVPRILGNPYPFQIIQTPGRVTFVYELNHVIRPIPLDKPQVSAEELEVALYYSGHSVAHWEGYTLVIETAGFNEKTFLDATGAPHSDAMTTIERIKKLNGTTLEDVITITDPEMFTKPWSSRFVYELHPEVRLEDYVCGEKHRDISKVQGVVVPK
jgi:hypothetical protein